jgi:hypothetical protein
MEGLGKWEHTADYALALALAPDPLLSCIMKMKEINIMTSLVLELPGQVANTRIKNKESPRSESRGDW